MPVFGLDISHHQDLALDLARCKREGIDFVFLKATEGATFVDAEFAANLAEARNAGQLVAAYHYVRSNVGAAAQVAHIQRVVPRDVPVIPDVEANSGAIGLTRDFVARLRAAGYRVPLLYLPRWYWQQIGQPSLTGLPPLWSSRYPDNVVGTIADEWADVPATYWVGYGGLDVAVLQFTSSARVAGHQPLDANAYRGTRAQLAALLGGEEEDMPLTNEDVINVATAVWKHMLWHPDVAAGVKAGDTVSFTNRYANMIPGVMAAVTAIANDVDITPEMLDASVNKAVAEHTATAEQIATAIDVAQRPHIEAAVRAVLGEDNAEQADAIVDELVSRLANPNPEGN